MSEGDGLIGRRLRRVEDPPLITGHGEYAGDHRLPGLVHLAFYRSPLGHARVNALDLSEARQAPGVLAAWAFTDLPQIAEGLGDSVDPSFKAHPRPVLGHGTARYQGEPLAVVVAETLYQAADAVEMVVADLEPLPAAPTLAVATQAQPPLVHGDVPDNLIGESQLEFGEVEAAFADAPVVVAAKLTVARICGGYMEPRVVTASWAEGHLDVWLSTQWTYGVRDNLARLLGLEKEHVRVRATDVGGGFGPKGEVYPEEILVGLASRELARPVTWTASRTEDTLSTAHAHSTNLELELAADRDGHLRGLRGRLLHDAGSYSASGTGQGGIMMPHMISAYHLPAASLTTQLIHTNTVPTGFVRGGARPVGNFAIERLMDRLAERLELDPVELRRRNLIQPEEMPYDTRVPAGRGTVVYDGGDYPRLLNAVVEALGEVQEGRREDGRLVGRAVVCCVESSGFGRKEPARARLDKDGRLRLFVGSTPGGQGHRTVAAQVIAERVGWPLEQVEVTAGDTDGAGWAQLTAGSRSATYVGNAAAQAGRSLRSRVLERAAHVMEADTADLILAEGRISVRGTPARALSALEVLPEDGLEVVESFTPKGETAYSSGCHGAVVSVDPETGSIDIERYVIAHDVGRSINPMLVEGQLQGGFAHGLGYALFEEAVYSAEGQLASATFLDYSLAGPPEVPAAELLHQETATEANPEGFKGAGESGTIPVPAAIAGAVERALRHLAPELKVSELPLSPERVRTLIGPLS
ncbi:MAG: xanthine dehydrogenase family protein molybdopterin-binding subunit [Candidatus Dormibacteraeota bacterium]|uniref:Xanthine dehydrogenase family protein molybdopterin-binding subunit n=1 Tax=Candidatus Dormiibacter inghamiae TaxID=3127013 RepID=A0A934KES8_9BACT|nr:xanthine dehydrogenase family protein molybdopterin-binding subunit [Candidatus Dormibacteraeota bacterium]MBJ7604920.1 xanthine dehydrogenase family protein molybdopterin-binding subunit [Candidatus Dormibacteraeota bacterium]